MNADRKLIYIFWRKTLLNAPEWNIHNRRGMHNYFYSNCSCGGAFRYIYFRGLINLGQKFNHKSIASGQQSLLAYDGTWVIYNVWLRGAIFSLFFFFPSFPDSSVRRVFRSWAVLWASRWWYFIKTFRLSQFLFSKWTRED